MRYLLDKNIIRRMINGYLQSHSRLNRRLQAMTRQLPAPFHQAALPHLATPDEVLSEWSIEDG